MSCTFSCLYTLISGLGLVLIVIFVHFGPMQLSEYQHCISYCWFVYILLTVYSVDIADPHLRPQIASGCEAYVGRLHQSTSTWSLNESLGSSVKFMYLIVVAYSSLVPVQMLFNFNWLW